MEKVNLERKIICASAGRVTDLQMARKIMKEAANLPLKDYFAGEPELCEYMLLQLGRRRDIRGLNVTLQEVEEYERKFETMTYGQACRKLLSDYQRNYDIKDKAIMAFACAYGREEQNRENDQWVFDRLNHINYGRINMHSAHRTLCQNRGCRQKGRAG